MSKSPLHRSTIALSNEGGLCPVQTFFRCLNPYSVERQNRKNVVLELAGNPLDEMRPSALFPDALGAADGSQATVFATVPAFHSRSRNLLQKMWEKYWNERVKCSKLCKVFT
jgi:hypothetical protein